jgi:PKD repeat protein
MIQRFLRIVFLICALVLTHRNAVAQPSASLAWDEDASAQVDGFAVMIDGVRVEYGLSPLNSNQTCGCAIVLPFSGGSHTLQAGAYNKFGESWSSVLKVAPVANAGGPYGGTARTAISVNGSGSQAPTGTITTYAWSWGDGTSATSSSSATATHTYASSGTFTVTLMVTDNAGASASAATTTTITASANLPPTINLTGPAGGSTFTAPASIAVAATARDSDGTVARVDFYAGSTLIGSATSSPYTATWVGVPGGTYVLKAVATDNLGATTSSATASITVVTGVVDTPPVATDDVATVRRFNRSVTIPVLQNDLDVDGDPLTIRAVGTPAQGSVRISGGTLVYTSSKRYVGPVTFAYTISDGRGGTATAAVLVTVTR